MLPSVFAAPRHRPSRAGRRPAALTHAQAGARNALRGLWTRHIAVATALAAAGCAETGLQAPDVRSEAAVEEALPAGVDLATWDRAELYSGWRAETQRDATG